MLMLQMSSKNVLNSYSVHTAHIKRNGMMSPLSLWGFRLDLGDNFFGLQPTLGGAHQNYGKTQVASHIYCRVGDP